MVWSTVGKYRWKFSECLRHNIHMSWTFSASRLLLVFVRCDGGGIELRPHRARARNAEFEGDDESLTHSLTHTRRKGFGRGFWFSATVIMSSREYSQSHLIKSCWLHKHALWKFWQILDSFLDDCWLRAPFAVPHHTFQLRNSHRRVSSSASGPVKGRHTLKKLVRNGAHRAGQQSPSKLFRSFSSPLIHRIPCKTKGVRLRN